MSETDQTSPNVTNADRAVAYTVLSCATLGPYGEAVERGAAAIAAYRVDRARQSLGIVREVIDNYRAEAVARGDKKTVNWIDRCLEAAEKPGE